MGQRRFHYEQAFEAYLRESGIPAISVDEARRSMYRGNGIENVGGMAGNVGGVEGVEGEEGVEGVEGVGGEGNGKARLGARGTIKSFDFVVYNVGGMNLLVDVKGRKYGGPRALGVRGMQNWVTRGDVESLGVWGELFGEGFEAAFVFMFWCEREPTDLLYQELFSHGGRWYTLWVVRLDDYKMCMRKRSAKWDTLSVPGRDFERMAQPLGKVVRV